MKPLFSTSKPKKLWIAGSVVSILAVITVTILVLASSDGKDSSRETKKCDQETVARLIATLESSQNRKEQLDAIYLLGKCGPSAAQALPELKKMIHHAHSTNDMLMAKLILKALERIEGSEAAYARLDKVNRQMKSKQEP